MRRLFIALALMITGGAPAFAGDFECVWRNLPSDVRAAFTRNTQIAEDINAVLNSGVLTEPMLVTAMTPCAIEDSEATTLGQYIAARALALAQRSRLLTQYGWHESQFDAVIAPVTPEDRELIVLSATGVSVDTSAAAMRLRASAQMQGLADEQGIRVAMEYIFARVVIEHLVPGMSP